MVKNIKFHNCDHILSKVFLALDGELSSEEEASFLAEINQCGDCLEKYQIEKNFKDFLSKKVRKECCFETLAQNIKNKLYGNSSS